MSNFQIRKATDYQAEPTTNPNIVRASSLHSHTAALETLSVSQMLSGRVVINPSFAGNLEPAATPGTPALAAQFINAINGAVGDIVYLEVVNYGGAITTGTFAMADNTSEYYALEVTNITPYAEAYTVTAVTRT